MKTETLPITAANIMKETKRLKKELKTLQQINQDLNSQLLESNRDIYSVREAIARQIHNLVSLTD